MALASHPRAGELPWDPSTSGTRHTQTPGITWTVQYPEPPVW